VKLYMNLIETAFPAGEFYDFTVPWWNALVGHEDRHSVAVFDQHWYTAWAGKQGAVGMLSGDVRARCDQPLESLRAMLASRVQGFASELASRVDGLKSCSEFSAGTNQDAVLACNDRDISNAFIGVQVQETERLGIQAFFWSWKMPYGPAFESGWSLKANAGMEDSPPPHQCRVLQRSRPAPLRAAVPAATPAVPAAVAPLSDPNKGPPTVGSRATHPSLRGVQVLYS